MMEILSIPASEQNYINIKERAIKINNKIEKDEYESQNSSTVFSSNLLDTNDNKSNNNITPKKVLSSASSFNKNILLLNLNKKGKNTRFSYYYKLISKNLLIRPEKKFNNIFIFDWDDTLFCTTVLCPYGYYDEDKEISDSIIEKIERLGKKVKKILIKAIEKGDTYIITNSELKWVEYSCKIFFPNVFELFKDIKIISARDLYSEQFPNNYKIWKIKVYNDITNNYSLDLPTNIIAFGDSSYDIEATYNLKLKFPKGLIKFIKFREFPLISDLIKQLTIAIDKFENFYSECINSIFRLSDK